MTKDVVKTNDAASRMRMEAENEYEDDYEANGPSLDEMAKICRRLDLD